MKNLFLKKILFGLLLSFLILIFSCEKEDDKIFLYLGKTDLDFGYDNNSINLSINNLSGKSIEWTASSKDDFISLSNNSGSLEPNSFEQIFVNVKRSELTGDSISSEITFNSSIGKSVTIEVFILNYPENKIRLDYKIKNAEYDKVNNRLFLIPYNENYIEIFNVGEETFERIDLQVFSYNNIYDIEVSSDGNYLAVLGYDYFYHIDVEKKDVVFQCDFDEQIESFVYGPNNKVYSFPYYWNSKMYCVDLISHQISIFDIDTDRTNAKLHPSRKYIYGINDYNTLLKIDIQTEKPEQCYSEYIFNIGYYLWIPGDGKKIITSRKKLLHINPDVSGYDVNEIIDLDIQGYNYIYHVEYNAEKNEYYIIPSNNQNNADNTGLYVYNSDLNFVRNIELEPFFFTNEDNNYFQVAAKALFAFSFASGQKLIVLTQPQSSSYSQTSAIEIILFKQ